MKSSRINLVLRELNNSIELSLEKSGSQLLAISRTNIKQPRVNGYKKPRISQQELLEFIEREQNCGNKLGAVDLLNSYLMAQGEIIDAQLLSIQKAVRHLVIAAESRIVAEDVKLRFIENSRSCLVKNVLPKMQQPKAKCMKCNAFYLEMPTNSLCIHCDGIVRNELRGNTWFECQICEGTGYNSRFSKPCGSCDQRGWLFIEAFKV